MDIHKPKPIHSWRELATEFGVIVLGILTALGLEQAVETYHEREQVETAHQAIENEIHQGIVDARLNNDMWDCTRTQLAALSDAVGRGDIARARHLLTTAGLPAPHAFADAAWQSALASGVTAGFSAEDQVNFPGVYAILEAVQGYQIDYFKSEARLESLLMSGLSSSPATATAAVPEVAQLNASLENLQASLRNYQRYVIGDLGFEFTDADRELYNSSEGSLKRIAQCKAAAAALGPAAKD